MRRRLIPWLAILAALTALLAWRGGSGSRQLRYYSPEDYVARANGFIRAGYLSADCGSDPAQLVAHLSKASDHEKQWFEDSYLAQDVQSYNSDPEGRGWYFVIDQDCNLRGVNPSLHAVPLPFRQRVRWLGRILYSGTGSTAALRSAQRTITLQQGEAPVSARLQGATAVGSKRDVAHQGAVLLHWAGGRAQPASRLHFVGKDVVLTNRSRQGRPERVRLMGHRLPVGRVARLDTGDWLNLEATSPSVREETFVYVGGEALEAASVVRLQNDRYDRRTDDPGLGRVLDPSRGNTYPYLAQVAGTVDRSLASLPTEEAERLAANFDLQLTLQRDDQLHFSRLFNESCRALERSRRLGRPLAGGLTVMDGKSGDILALATFPHEEDLAKTPPADERARRRLLQNQNLVRHPIGSAGKPFFFAAVADTFPFLLDLQLDEHPPERFYPELLHCEIPKGYQHLGGHYGPIDFRGALEMSCNKYTMELATLALAADPAAPSSASLQTLLPPDPKVDWPLPGRSSGIHIAGRELDYAPDLSQYIPGLSGRPRDPQSGAAQRCVSMSLLEQAPYRAVLERLTGAATYIGLDPQQLPEDATRRQLERGYRTNRFDLQPLYPLLAHLTDEQNEETLWQVRASLQEVAPERVNLAFNQITRMRGDYVSLLLGGGSSIWTNIQLAEAMSRLVTGHYVDAKLIAEVLPREEEEVAPEVEPPLDLDSLSTEITLNPKVRSAVLEGLSRVVEGGRGTATDLRDELQRVRAAFSGDRIELYAKTGSPVLERAVPTALSEALSELVRRGHLELQAGQLMVSSSGSTRAHSAPGKDGRQEMRTTLDRALIETGYRSNRNRLLRPLLRLMDRFAEDLAAGTADDPDEVDGPMFKEGNQLRLNREDSLFRQRLIRDMGSVFVFTLVRLPGQSGKASSSVPPTPQQLAAPDARVLTVAIHLDLGPDSRVAVAVAEKILPELIPLLARVEPTPNADSK